MNVPVASNLARVVRAALGWTAAWFALSAAWVQAVPPVVTVGPDLDGQVTLRWDPVPSATVFELRRFLDEPSATVTATPVFPSATPTPRATFLPGGTLQYEDPAVTNGRRYRYELTTRYGAGPDDLSRVWVVPYAPPLAVDSLRVSNAYSGSLSLVWDDSSTTYPVAYYEVYRCAWSPSPTFTPTGTPPTATPTPTGDWTPGRPTPPASFAVADWMTLSPTPIATVAGRSLMDAPGFAPGADIFYYYWARALDNQGHAAAFPARTSGGALPVTAIPVAPLLAYLAGPSVTPQVGATGYGVRLIWENPAAWEGVSTYHLYRNGGWLADVAATTAATLTYDDTTADGGDATRQAASYFLTLSNASGAVTGNAVTVTLARSLALGPLVATPDATAQAVTLHWAGASAGLFGFSGYKVYRSASGVPTGTGTITPTPLAFIPVTPSQTATPSYVDTGVPDADGLVYWVSAVDNVGWEGPKRLATPVTLRLAPTPPSGLVASGPVGNHRVRLAWSGGGAGFYGPVQAYRISRMIPAVSVTLGGSGTPTPTFTAVPVATVSSSVTQCVDVASDVGDLTPVIYRVAALDALGNASDPTAWSSPVTLQALTAPGEPSPVTISGDNQSLAFSWGAAPTPDAVTGYRLFGADWATTASGGTTPTPTPLAVMTATPGPMTVTRSGLGLFQVLVNYLLADNTQGPGAPATLSGIPVPSYQVQAVVLPASRSVSVSWTLALPTPGATPGVEGFRVYRSYSAASGFSAVTQLAGNSSFFIDTTVPDGKTVYYRVTVYSGNLSESPLFPTQVPGPVGQAQAWPSQPVSVTLSAGASSATLAWAPNASGENVGSYNVYENGGSVPVATVGASPGPSYQAALTPGARSYFRISAVNGAGEGVACGALSVLAPPAMTPQVGLTPPPSVTPTPNAIYVSGLTYDHDVQGFNLYRSYWATPSVTPQEAEVGSVTNPTGYFSDAGVSGYTTYYRVVARDAEGLEAPHASSPLLSIETAPGLPSTLGAQPSFDAVTLSWAPPTGDAPVTGYVVYREATPGSTRTVLGTLSAPTTQYVDSGAVSGGVSFYGVAARNAAGEGPLTERGVLFLPAPTVRITPGSMRNTLVWAPVVATATPPFNGYTIFRAQSPSTVLSAVGSVAVTAATPCVYVDSTVSEGATYVYQVVPSTAGGALGGWSAPLTQSVLPQPVDLKVVGLDRSAQLNWTYQGPISVTYQVQRRMGTQPDTAYQTLATGLSGSSYQDSGLENKELYLYRVLTVSSAGSTQSAAVPALPAKPPVVQGEVSAEPIEGGVSMAWAPANPVSLDVANQYPLAGYRVYRSLDGGGTYQWVGSTPVTAWIDPVDVLSGDTRTYQIRAYDAPPDAPDLAHESAYPVVRVDSLTAHTALDRNAIHPFGSQAERSVNIRFVVTESGHVTLKVYSISGVLVKNLVSDQFGKGVHWTQWDATNGDGQRVASGVYLVITQMPHCREVAKVAVVK